MDREFRVPMSDEVLVEEVLRYNRRTVGLDEARACVGAKLAQYPNASAVMVEAAHLRALMASQPQPTVSVEKFDAAMSEVHRKSGLSHERDWELVTAVLHQLGIEPPRQRGRRYWREIRENKNEPGASPETLGADGTTT